MLNKTATKQPTYLLVLLCHDAVDSAQRERYGTSYAPACPPMCHVAMDSAQRERYGTSYVPARPPYVSRRDG